MKEQEKWLDWAVELQSLAQAGLTYSKDPFDIERFERIREISAEMVAHKADISVEKAKELFCNEHGYQTPKLDSRAAVFQNGKILLVQERDGRWAQPGGWVDVGLSVAENTIKEAKEEAGVDVIPQRVIAIHDAQMHCKRSYAHKVCKVFLLCNLIGGSFTQNIETLRSDWFSLSDLPPLAEEKSNVDQIKLCFDAYQVEHWDTRFE